MKMTFFILFLICTLKNQNFAEKFANLAKNWEKMNSTEFMEFCGGSVAVVIGSSYSWHVTIVPVSVNDPLT